ncbi:hypothetical protein J6590_099269 [Homalodisca vitripennis]|nr:hypothetical protein J6590_099269 [Homalodisca vitripennis]
MLSAAIRRVNMWSSTEGNTWSSTEEKHPDPENAASGITPLSGKSSNSPGWEQEERRRGFDHFPFNTGYDDREDAVTRPAPSDSSDCGERSVMSSLARSWNRHNHDSESERRTTRPTEYNFFDFSSDSEESRRKPAVGEDVVGCSWWKPPESGREKLRPAVENRHANTFATVGRRARRRRSHRESWLQRYCDASDSEEERRARRRRLRRESWLRRYRDASDSEEEFRDKTKRRRRDVSSESDRSGRRAFYHDRMASDNTTRDRRRRVSITPFHCR